MATKPGIKLSDAELARLVDSEIVWSHQVSRGSEFKAAVCTAEDRDRLVAAFGQDWFDIHLLETQQRLDRWALTGIDGLVH